MTGPNPDPGEIREEMSQEHERARALAAVLRDQEERALAAREAEARRLRRDRIRRGALLATWIAVAYVWIGSPSWLDEPPPPQPSIVEEVRALRVDLFLQSQKIEAYRAEHGRLPWVLPEAGPPFPGVVYRRKDSRSYELEGTTDRVRLRYESESPPRDFVGSASAMLESRDATGSRTP
jgi:hypothetical protein